MNLHKTIKDLAVGDKCYLLRPDYTVEIITVTEVLESMRSSDCMKIRFDRCLPDIHAEGSANMVSLDLYFGSLYLESNLVLNELEYRQNVIARQIDKLKDDRFIFSKQKFSFKMQTNVL